MTLIKLWKSLALPVLLGFLFLGGYLIYHLGALRRVEVQVADSPTMYFLFKDHRGPYHLINEAITEVENWTKAKGVPCPQTFGEYLDDPQLVAEDRLRSRGGCTSSNPIQVAELPAGFKISERAPAKFVRAEFSGSPAIGPWIVYPKLKEFITQQNLKTEPVTIEVYTVHPNQSMTTTYLVPISGP